MDFLKYIDFFNIKFYFYTNHQQNYQNLFGGIMAFLYLLICISIFLGFSLDDMNRLNPTTTMNEIPNSERKLVNMIDENLWIPFRIVNYENKFVDHRGSLHVVPYLIEGRFNNKTGMDLKYHLLNYKFCNETSMANMPLNYKIDIPLDQLFCLDRDSMPFGGNWNEEYLNYIEINMYLCEEGIPYNLSDSRCQKIDKFLNKINSSLLFDFYFPIVQFQPTNLDNPIKIIYKNYYYRLTSYSYKVQKLYLREHILLDDKNLIKAKYINYTSWGMSSLYSDDYFLPSNYDPISNNSNTSRIYALNIYMDDGFVYYTRSYKKILLIISNVFPLFKIAFYFIKKITVHAKMSLTKRKLTGLIFENSKIMPKQTFSKKFEDLKLDLRQKDNKSQFSSNKSENELIKEIISNNNDSNELNDINFIKKMEYFNINKKNNIENKKDNYINNTDVINNKKVENSLNTHLNNNNDNNEQNYNNLNTINTDKINSNINISNNLNHHININNYIYSNNNNKNILNNKISKSLNDENLKKFKEISLLNSKKKSSFIYDPIETKDNLKKINMTYQKSKYIFPYHFFLLDIFFNNVTNAKKMCCVSKAYLIVYKFMCSIYDISTHLILFKQFNLLYNLVSKRMFEEKENGFYDYYILNKININDDKVMEKLDNTLNSKNSLLYSNYFL